MKWTISTHKTFWNEKVALKIRSLKYLNHWNSCEVVGFKVAEKSFLSFILQGNSKEKSNPSLNQQKFVFTKNKSVFVFYGQS